MLNLPSSTEFGRRVPKQKFYEHLDVSPEVKRLFIDQIKLITWANKLSPQTMNLGAGQTVTEIEVFHIRLAGQELDKRTLELMDRQIPYHILFVLERPDGQMQLRISYKEAAQSGDNAFRLRQSYATEFAPPENLTLPLDALDMDSLYASIVRAIAGDALAAPEQPLEQAVAQAQEKEKLQRQIAQLKAKMKKEKNLGKQMELRRAIRRLDDFEIGYLELDDETKKAYRNPDNDPRGIYRMLGCWARGTQGGVKYDFTSKTGEYFSERLWLFSKENLEKLDRDNKLIFKGDNVYRKMFIYENKGKTPETLWEDVSNAANASDEIKRLFGGIIFDTPKPIPYIKRMIQLAASKDSVIMDFFSGSATTAHAVMQLNSEDGGHRKFIMVQLPEKCDEASEAYKAGYKNICEIGKERIRRAGDKIQSEHPDAKLDTGFRVFRVDESNMEDIYYHPEELTQTMLGGMVSNIKPDRTDLDLLYACLLDWGVEISLSHTQTVIDGCTVHNVDNGALCACFDERVPLSVIDYMAKQQPLRAVFRDSSFAADDSKINVTEIFKNLSPDTKVKVI